MPLCVSDFDPGVIVIHGAAIYALYKQYSVYSRIPVIRKKSVFIGLTLLPCK